MVQVVQVRVQMVQVQVVQVVQVRVHGAASRRSRRSRPRSRVSLARGGEGGGVTVGCKPEQRPQTHPVQGVGRRAWCLG
jgi:hypothetical protein